MYGMSCCPFGIDDNDDDDTVLMMMMTSFYANGAADDGENCTGVKLPGYFWEVTIGNLDWGLPIGGVGLVI
jgi:hypothetical protein